MAITMSVLCSCLFLLQKIWYWRRRNSECDIYWKMTDNKPDWMEIENELCLPFSPKEQLSQKSWTTNPILVHCKEVWAKVHKMYKLLQYVQIYALFLTKYSVSGESSNVKLLWQRDLRTNFTQEKWLGVPGDCGKYIREPRGKFTQYMIIHRYYHTPVTLHRMKLMNDNMC